MADILCAPATTEPTWPQLCSLLQSEASFGVRTDPHQDGEARHAAVGEFLATERDRCADGRRVLAPGVGQADAAGDGPWPITAEQVYSERFMFHGPAFQCVAALGTLGNPGATAALAVRPRDRLFASISDPLLLTDPCVLDGVGQVVGLWAKMNGLGVLPTGVDSVEFYCPPPPPGTTVPIRIEVVMVDRDAARMRSDVELGDGQGGVWARLAGWADFIMPVTDRYMSSTDMPQRYAWSQELSLPEAPPGSACALLTRDDFKGVNLEWTARLFLHARELAEYRALDKDARRRQFLAARAAAKDAIRLWWARKHGASELPHPSTLVIAHDAAGRPFLEGDEGMALPGLSIAHTEAGAAAIAADVLAWRRWKRGLLAASRAASRVAETARGLMEYTVVGQGPPLLVIHGGMGGHDQALGLGALVNGHAGAAAFTVLAPSRPGYSRTPLQVGLTPEEQADALAAWLDHLAVGQVGVLAGSYGGPVAVQFALRHPHRLWALVLLAAIIRRSTVGQQWPLSDRTLLSRPGGLLIDFFHWLLHLRARCQPLALIRAFTRQTTARSVDDAEIDRRVARLGQFPEQVRAVQDMFGSLTPLSVQMAGCLNDEKQIACLPDYPLEEVRAPTLFVCGREDCVGPGAAGAEWAAAKVPGARLFLVEQCGHFMQAGENVAPVFSTIAEFLCGHAPPGGGAGPAPVEPYQETVGPVSR